MEKLEDEKLDGSAFHSRTKKREYDWGRRLPSGLHETKVGASFRSSESELS
jgi:hypothetical protein